ncbi:MAG: NADPH-dependent F420 reductase [Promethearchaeota archaeon]
MRIGIIGTGNIGRTLGKKWINAGHQVKFGTRNLSKEDTISFVKSLGSNASFSNIKEAISTSEIIVLAIPGSVVQEFFSAYGKDLTGKVIIDPSNNINAETMNSLQYFNKFVEESEYYRAFNSLGWENYDNPTFGTLKADLLYCGSNNKGQSKVEQLIKNVGLNPICIGGLEVISIVDSILGVWFQLALKKGYGRHLAFKVLKD